MDSLKTLFEQQFSPHLRILVIGDLILDEYLFGNVDRISPEAPIPIVLLQEDHEDFRLGGAANVALNIVSLGLQVHLIGGIGNDPQGQHLEQLLRDKNIVPRLIPLQRKTTWKRRVLGQNKQMLRIDRERNDPLNPEEQRLLQDIFLQELPNAHLLLLSDYGKGFLTTSFLTFAIQQARQHHLKILVDPKGKNYQKYRGASVLTPNKKEAEEATQISLDPIQKEELNRCAEQLIETAELEAAIITLGKEGVCLKEKEKELFLATTRARSVYDITGAGDTFIACLGYALANHYPYLYAVQLANVAAGIKVAKQGTKEVTRDEILFELSNHPLSAKKIFHHPSQLQDILLHRENTTLVLLALQNMSFSLLKFLQSLPGESLFVVIWNTEEDKTKLLAQTHLVASLEMVRWVSETQSLSALLPLKIQHTYYQKELNLSDSLPGNWISFSLESE